MKIIYIDMQYDYGIKSKGDNLIAKYGLIPAMQSFGAEIIVFYYDDYLSEPYPDELQKKIISFVKNNRADAIFINLYTNQFKPQTIKEISSEIMTIGWFGDDQWRFEKYTSQYANVFNWCITTDKYSILKYNDIGQKNVILSQWAAIDDEIDEIENSYKYDVSFIGGKNSNRSWFINELRANGIKVNAFGNGWENGFVTLDEMKRIFRESKINLNLSNSVCYDIRFYKARVKKWLYKKGFHKLPLRILQLIENLNIIIDNHSKNISQIKARNFEIPYYGGFQLSEYIPDISDYFQHGKEIICYKDVDDAVRLINYYLVNEKERESIRIAGNKKALSHHGYKNRIYDIFIKAGLIKE